MLDFQEKNLKLSQLKEREEGNQKSEPSSILVEQEARVFRLEPR